MDHLTVRSWQERDGHEGVRDAWLASREALVGRDWSQVAGTCGLCGSSRGFVLTESMDPRQPDIREGLLCRECRHNSRIRSSLRLLLDQLESLDHPPAVYLTEQVTGTFIWLQRHLRGTLLGSEFEPSFLKRMALTRRFHQAGGKGTVEYQDVTKLNFADASLDAIASFEVFEHVPDYRTAVSEFARVLKPGGTCVATFPFTDGPDTITRALVDEEGEVRHLLEPEYHGDPISGGVLCFYHFGWDVLDVFRSAGFSDVRMVMPCGLEHGLFYGLWTLVATR
ncbi:class I SAM-dependent methyltransferase [Luteimonas marina]|nr:class I SAM-dependent methyltransferase [Luteimonas marina]